MSETPFLDLPLLAAAQAQKHVTHNEALMRLDALTHLGVARRASQPPDDAADGERLLIAANPSGAFSGKSDAIAWRIDSAWRFLAPKAGWRIFVSDEQALLAWTGSFWKRLDASLNPAPLIGVNATADAGNRLAVKSDAVLLSHDDITPGTGSMQLKLNKSSASKTASVLFQTNYSGRIEIGAIGDESLSLRASLNGSTWMTRLTVTGDNGWVGVGVATPAARLDLASTFNNGLRLSTASTAVGIHSFDAGGGSPICDLDVMASGAGAAASFRFFRTLNTAGAAAIHIMRANGSATANSLLSANGNSYLNLAVGNVGIGVAAPADKLTVAGIISPASDNAFALGSSARRWSTLYAVTGTINTSDARMKTDVAECQLGLAFLRDLKPKSYRWRIGRIEPLCGEAAAGPRADSDGDKALPGLRLHLGLIAQDVKAALDRADVDCGLWVMDDPSDPDSVQSLRYDQFIAPLIQGVKELADRLDAFERRLSPLERAVLG